MKESVIFILSLLATTVVLESKASEARGDGEQATPGQATPIIDYTNLLGPVAQPVEAPAPRTGQGIARKQHECHKWTEWQLFKDARSWGKWRDAGGTWHDGEWRCQVNTKYRYPSTHLGISGECANLNSIQCGILGASACSDELQRKYRNSPPIKVSFYGTIVVKDSKQFSGNHCRVQARHSRITTANTEGLKSRPVRENRYRGRPMKIGRHLIDIDVPITNANGRGTNRFSIVGRNYESERYDRGIRIGRVKFVPN